MKRIISVILFLSFFTFSAFSCNGISVSAQSAIVYCKDNNEVYYSLNENKNMKMASTTKIMTALIALEHSKKHNKKVEFTREMIAEGSSMYLKIGEVVTLKDLAIGLMLCSGNDAANAVAIGISGSIEDFAILMNKRAKSIGMENTSFANPSGLDDDNHYSTAKDMALLMSEAMSNKDFAEITKMKTATVKFCSPKDKIVTYSNHNRLLSMYEYCIGGKTGYTMASGRCLVTVSKKDSLTLICVTLNDRQDYKDHITLYEYVYDKYYKAVFDDRELYYNLKTDNGQSSHTMVCCEDISEFVFLKSDKDKIKREIKFKKLTAPVIKGQNVGKIIYKFNGEIIAKHKLIAVEDNQCQKIIIWEYIKEFFKNAFKSS